MVTTIDSINTATNAAPRAAIRKAGPERDIAADIRAADDATAKEDAGKAPISPRITQDALAGAIVTEFSNAQGEITQQVPSAAALAYLRAGLTAQGNPKADEVANKKES